MNPNTNVMKTELYRAIVNPRLFASLILAFICLWIGGRENFLYYDVDFADTFLSAHSSGAFSIIAILFPLLASFPFAASCLEDTQALNERHPIKESVQCKTAVLKLAFTALTGAIAIGVPCLLYALACILKKGGLVLQSDSGAIVSLFKDLYYDNPLLYVMIFVLNAAVCGAIFAVLSLGVSAVIRNRYAALLLPFCYYMFSGIVLVQFNIKWNAIAVFALNEYATASIEAVMIYDVVLLCFGIGLYLIGIHRNKGFFLATECC